MTRIITIANHKGGVGKTTTVASVGAILASKGKSTLLIDLDAQANLTGCFLKNEPEQSVYNSFKEEKALPIVQIRTNLDLVPSSLDMAGVELDISGKFGREYILKELLSPIAGIYDYILIDTPPSLGLVTVNAFAASKEIFIPITAEAMPTKGLLRLYNFLQMVQAKLNKDIKLTGVILTRWEKSNLSKDISEQIRKMFPDALFNTRIRKNIALAEAPLYATDISDYAPKSNGAKDYEALTKEIIKQETTIK